MKNTSFFPYTMKSFVDWVSDNGFIPRIKFTVDEQCGLPQHLFELNEVYMDLHFNAVRNLFYDNDLISFDARFSSIKHTVFIPYNNIIEMIVVSPDQKNLLAIDVEEFKDLDIIKIATDFNMSLAQEPKKDFSDSKPEFKNLSEPLFDDSGRKYRKFGSLTVIDCNND